MKMISNCALWRRRRITIMTLGFVACTTMYLTRNLEFDWATIDLILEKIWLNESQLNGNRSMGNHLHNGSQGSLSYPKRDTSSSMSSVAHSPYIDGNPDRGWMDNGIIYRPINKSSSIKEQFLSQKLAIHEPYLQFNESSFFQNVHAAAAYHQNKTRKKVILWYIPSRYTPNMPSPQPLRFCPDYPCVETTNRKYANHSAMMVLNGQIIVGKPPKRASPDQIFLFHNQEPPIAFGGSHMRKTYWRGVFNWTMSFRNDSDIPTYFGDIRKHPDPPKKDYKKILTQKTKKVAWIVSHCRSPGKRDDYVKELKKYIEVDVYGGCGDKQCGRDQSEKCSNAVGRSHKFYLAFESSICTDYISEKFFMFMPYNIVVVARASNEFHRFASPDTFINTADFSSPKKLAERLLYLDKHDEEYINILKRKDQYIYLFEDYPIRGKDGHIVYMHYQYDALSFCEACKRLWNLDRYRKNIPDLVKWFDLKLCKTPNDYH